MVNLGKECRAEAAWGWVGRIGTGRMDGWMDGDTVVNE